MVQAQLNEKLHTACDECRSRKLKCSGELPRCTRCKKESIKCMYSPQKQMGRPRKRRREGEAGDSQEVSANATESNGVIMTAEFPNFGVVTPLHRSHNGSLAPTVTPFADLGTIDTFGLSPVSVSELAAEPPIDPSLWDTSLTSTQTDDSIAPVSMAPCTCLSLMYLTLTELQSVSSFHFPQVIVPLRKAMGVLSDLIHCPQCPRETFSAMQNIQSIIALFKAIVERFHRVLIAIDTEAIRLHETGEKKPYRIGDNSPGLHHLHTGTLDCPMGFNIEIEAREWKRLAKTALRTEIYGNGSNPRPLMQLLKEVIERQQRWHEDDDHLSTERRQIFGKQYCDPADAKKSCETLGADHIKRAVDNLNWE